ncbi:MAG TPA: ATP-binding protein [Polyangiaceae bacterium]|nr:ATP-binding protein [Polyangiaceae bacterium]
MENIEDYAIFLLDADGCVATWNRGAEKIKGYSACEIVGEHFSKFYDRPDIEGGLPARALEVAREQGRVEAEGYRVRKDGSRFWANVVITALRNPDGSLRGFGKITRDLSERMQADETAHQLIREQAALEANARLLLAEARTKEHLALLARAGEALCATTDYEEILQRVVHMALPELGDFAVLDIVENGQVRRLVATHDDPEVEGLIKPTTWIRWERQDRKLCALSSGESACHSKIDDAWMQDVARDEEHLERMRRLKLCSLITVPLRGRDELLGSLTLCYGRSGRQHEQDDLRLAEELARRAHNAVIQARLHREARQAARRAEEASRSKDEFLATVSHELRTPLNAIVGWATLLRGRHVDAALDKGIAVIYRNAHAQVKIIDDILDVSRIVTGKLRLEPRPIDLITIVRDGIEVVRPSALARELVIEFTPPTDPCLLCADPERLQQVIWNLLSNAVKFTEPGGKVRIGIERVGSQVKITVQDSGKGIDAEFLPFVFDRFKQADGSTTRRVGGLGLGLALVRHLVELHGGQVRADSEGAGKGSTFTVTLPVRAVAPALGVEDDDPIVDRETPVRPASIEGLRILVVDDEADARDLLSEVLSEAGAEIRTAGSAAEAFRLLEKFNPHVLVSDIGMPHEDGYSFMRRVRGLDPAGFGGVPSIALTAYTRGEDKTKALSSGFTTHIGKPVSPDALLAAVGNLAQFSRVERWRS